MKNKLCCLGVVFLSCFVSTDLYAYSGGAGSADDPYQIGSKQDLLDLAANTADYASNFVMTANIDLAGTNFTGTLIGEDIDHVTASFQGTPFTGVFDGGGHTISNLTINTGADRDYIGLFGRISGADAGVRNVSLVNADIDTASGSLRVGSLCGQVT